MSETPLSVTPASAWMKPGEVQGLLTLPSGKVVRARAVGIEAFVSAGLVPNTLLPVVQRMLKGEEAPSAQEVDNLLNEDPKSVTDMLQLTDSVFIYCVEEPEVRSTPVDDKGNPIVNRPVGEWIYVDYVDMEDKLFVLQWAMGGTSDLDRFREEYRKSLESVPASPRVAPKSKSTSRARAK